MRCLIACKRQRERERREIEREREGGRERQKKENERERENKTERHREPARAEKKREQRDKNIAACSAAPAWPSKVLAASKKKRGLETRASSMTEKTRRDDEKERERKKGVGWRGAAPEFSPFTHH